MEYTHGGDIYTYENIVDFSVNINPLGPSDAVLEAAKRGVEHTAAYPDSRCRRLRAKLAEKLQVPGERILFGNGAAELIYTLVLAEKPKKALLPVPAFSEYEQALLTVGCQIDYPAATEENGFVVDESILERLDSDVDILFLCSPSNPSGRAIRKELLLKIAARCEEKKIRFVLDECFVEFLPDAEEVSMLRQTERFSTLFVLRAFTKIYGMPGLRLGYGVSSDLQLLESMAGMCQPWSVSIPAQEAGIAALDEDERTDQVRRLVRREREYIEREMSRMRINYISSDANFILFRGGPDLFEQMKQQGILIRDCSNYRGLGRGWYRTAVKTHEENRRLLKALEEADISAMTGTAEEEVDR